jgi:polyisoprenoid-binding protein YceI
MKYFVLVALALPVAFWSASATQPVASAPVAAAKTLKVDAVHSSIVFRCMHLNTAWAYGRFDKFEGNIVLDGANSKVELEIDPASVNTANGGRDDHLRGPDFFDVKQFPKASFKSTKVVPDGESKMKVDGDLTLHGVTKPISFVVEKTGSVDDPKFGKKTGFHATLVVKRSEFGITYMKGGLGEDVEFMVSLEANEG